VSTKAEFTEGLLFEARQDKRKKRGLFVSGRARGRKTTLLQVLEELQAITQGAEAVAKKPKHVLLLSFDDDDVLQKARSLISLFQHRLADFEDREMERLIEAAMPALSDRPPPAALEQARRNAELRADFLQRYEVLDTEKVHKLYGSKADNKAALAGRWRGDGKIFGIDLQGRTVYPAFQFDASGKPKPIIAKVLRVLGGKPGPWQIAIWFTSANGWLDGRCPVDVMDTDPDAVIEAARDIGEPTLF